ncbi:MAG: hypothetical protein U0T84_06100 [Chitinophagales bacterium]
MRNSICLALIALLFLASCKKDKQVFFQHEVVSTTIDLSDDGVQKIIKLPTVVNYFNKYHLAPVNRIRKIDNGLRSQFVIPLSRTLKSNTNEQEVNLFVTSNELANVVALYEVKEHLYFNEITGYDIRSLIDMDHILREYAWLQNPDGTFTPTVRSCGVGMGYGECVWSCFQSFFSDWVSGITCSIAAVPCMTGAAIACMLIQAVDPNEADRFKVIEGINQSMSNGYIEKYIEENNTFIIK